MVPERMVGPSRTGIWRPAGGQKDAGEEEEREMDGEEREEREKGTRNSSGRQRQQHVTIEIVVWPVHFADECGREAQVATRLLPARRLQKHAVTPS